MELFIEAIYIGSVNRLLKLLESESVMIHWTMPAVSNQAWIYRKRVTRRRPSISYFLYFFREQITLIQ